MMILRLIGVLAVVIGPTVATTVSASAEPPRAVVADTIRGTVRDSAGMPVPRVHVVLVELERGTLTDANGTFRFGNVAPGSYTLVINRIGYGTQHRIVTAVRQPIAVVLATAATPVSPISVTATRAPIDRLDSPLPADAVEGEPLRRTPQISLTRALDHVGVRSLSTGLEIGKPVIRGLSGARVLVLDDGSRLEDYSWSDEDGPSVDPQLAERIEIIRGPASLMYGSDAIGGVINVVPHDLPDATAVGSVRRGTFGAYAASNNHEFGSMLSLEGASGPWAARAFIVGRKSEALHTPNGELENTGFSAIDGEAVVGVRGDRGSAQLRYARYDGEFKLLEAGGPRAFDPMEGEEEGEEEEPERKVSDDRVQLTGNLFVGDVRFEAKGQFQRHWISELSDDLVEPGEPREEIEVFDLLLNTGTLDLMAHHGSDDKVSGTIGVSGTLQGNDTRGEVPLVPDARTTSGALFVIERVNLGKVILLTGGRVDVRHVEADANAELGLADESRDYSVVTGDVGLVYQPIAGLAFAVNAGRAWRAPTLFELWSNGPRLGEARFEMGSAQLDPEKSFNVDGSVRFERGPLRAEVAAYHNTIDDFIFVSPTTNFVDSLRVYRYLQANATLWGGEVSTSVEAAPILTLQGRVDYVHGSNDEADQPLPLMPPARGVIEAELHTAPGHSGTHGYVSLATELVARQDRLASYEVPGEGFTAFDIPTDAYTLLHARAGVEGMVGSHHTHMDVAVRNVANTSYRDFLNRYKEFALDPGRNIVVQLSTDF